MITITVIIHKPLSTKTSLCLLPLCENHRKAEVMEFKVNTQIQQNLPWTPRAWRVMNYLALRYNVVVSMYRLVNLSVLFSLPHPILSLFLPLPPSLFLCISLKHARMNSCIHSYIHLPTYMDTCTYTYIYANILICIHPSRYAYKQGSMHTLDERANGTVF